MLAPKKLFLMAVLSVPLVFGACAHRYDGPNYAKGIDVSHFQGSIDWSLVKGGDVSFAYIKASEGITYTDPKFVANWQGTADAGIVRGGYHKFVAKDAGEAQARNFLNALKSAEAGAGAYPTLPPVLDIEVVRKEDLAVAFDEMLAWLAVVEGELGCKPIIYTSPNNWNKEFPDKFRGYELWLADYAAKPTLPKGWHRFACRLPSR